MKPNGGGVPTGKIADLINSSFSSYENFRKEFIDFGMKQFGSGWVWLVLTSSGVKIMKSPNAECPLTEPDHIPLLTMDVWEHAYYLNYKNNR